MQFDTHFGHLHLSMAAMSAHALGTIPSAPTPIQYSNAVFQTFDENATSRSASASTAPRASPLPPTVATVASAHHLSTTSSTSICAGPFASRSNVRPAPFPSSFQRSLEHDAPAALARIHPSDLEATESLMRLSSSVEPIIATPREQYSQPPPLVDNGHLPVHAPAAGPVPAVPIPKNEGDASPHPSTSPEDNVGPQSDVFSVGENSDTISDPDVEVDRHFATQPSQPQSMPFADPLVEESAIHIAQPTPLGPHRTAATLLPGLDSRAMPFHSSLNSTDQATEGHQVDYTPYSALQTQHKLYDPSAPVLPMPGVDCSCRTVPDELLRVLDTPEAQSSDTETLVRLYKPYKNDMCARHKIAYASVLADAVELTSAASMAVAAQAAEEEPQTPDEEPLRIDHEPVTTGSGTVWRAVPMRKRATSIPGIYEYEFDLPSKRLRAAEKPESPVNGNYHTPGIKHSPRPRVDTGFDEQFRRQVLGELARDFTDLKEDDWSRGECNNRYIYKILSKCKHPNTDPRCGPVDAGFLSGQEAADAVERGTESFPIFTEGQQQFQWKDESRPIAQLFGRMEDLTREVAVQIPSHSFDIPSYETKTLAEIQDRFLAATPSPDPWNILDLRSPLPPSILPSFLTGENCQLLPRIRDSLLEGHTAERTKAHREDWNVWTELLEWVLMSEGGHNTAPHMDSHGWSTWITIQEGHFGFGWLSRPTEKERADWMADPLAYTGGSWRFAILKPGQTVFFPSGTIHFVFRLHDRQTLALGGHLLQWTALERWMEVILWQLKNPNITNEDMGKSPLKYIHIARRLVDHRMKTFRLQSMGGMPAVANFMARASVSKLSMLFFLLTHTNMFTGSGEMVKQEAEEATEIRTRFPYALLLTFRPALVAYKVGVSGTRGEGRETLHRHRFGDGVLQGHGAGTRIHKGHPKATTDCLAWGNDFTEAAYILAGNCITHLICFQSTARRGQGKAPRRGGVIAEQGIHWSVFVFSIEDRHQ